MKQLSISHKYLGSGDEISIICGTDLIHEFPKHAHDSFCIGISEKGERDLFLGGELFRVHDGDLFFINHGVSHSCITYDEHSYKILCSSQSLLSSVVKEITPARKGEVRFNQICVKDETLRKKGEMFFSAFESGEFSVMVDELFNTFLASAVMLYADISILPIRERGDLMAAKRYILKNLASDISLKNCADEAGLSPYYFTHLFSEINGISPYQYIIQERVKYAQKMLSAQCELSRVAVDSGFYDQSHFTRHFKRITGCTPGEFAIANL